MFMPHQYAKLSDAEIDAIRSRRDTRAGASFLMLVITAIGCGLVGCLARSGSIGNIAEDIAALSVLAIFGYFFVGLTSEDELKPLDRDPELLDRTLELFSRSLAARNLRDEILRSGRCLRVFDYDDLCLVHVDALHRQKVQQLNGLKVQASE